MDSKADRVEAVNVKIVELMLVRARVRRYKGSWDEEQKITEQIAKLETEIKSIQEE